jgi:hypothetical protein
MTMTSLRLLTLLLPGVCPVEPQPLEWELIAAAKQVIKHCEDKGCKNIGVLKFRVTKDGKTFRDDVGTLNVFLARRLEVALVLAQQNPREHPGPIGIIDNATAVAHRTMGANHLSKDGRLRLFEPSYPLAWGETEVKPDAFVTGVAEVSKDWKTLTIQLLVFDKTENKLGPLGNAFMAANPPEQLGELGESFHMRGWKDPVWAESEAPALHPAQDPAAPVKLEVRYDGQVVPIEVKSDKAYVPEPRQGQKVELVLQRDNSRERYGVVLKVNGENTLQRQRLPDRLCRCWVLDPGRGPLTIDGYHINAKQKEAFVLSAHQPQAGTMDYGDVRMITLTVFGERKGKRPILDVSDEAEEARVVHKGTLASKQEPGEPAKPDTLYVLTARLLLEDLLLRESAQPWTVAEMDADPLPVLCLTVLYYNPRNPSE